MKYPIYKPFLDNREKEFVNDCLDSTWISSRGKYVDLFELKIRELTGAKYSIAVFNGTVALHLALLSLGIKEGDKVIVPTNGEFGIRIEDSFVVTENGPRILGGMESKAIDDPFGDK